ncbi:hypothetical protein LCGC14_0791580 [marine sediment metagenome]|uniref:Uncharacterized protein n=1 Tax=marine sediment metagenome TaxID=412755 RepID=A0A0F9QC47_9ZZZZ
MVERPVDPANQNEWEAGPDEDLKVPREYIEDLKFEVIVFARKERGGQDFTFRCKDYSPVEGGAWSFDGVIIDTSKRDPSGDVTLKRLTYHPALSLVNVAFMVVPAPEETK